MFLDFCEFRPIEKLEFIEWTFDDEVARILGDVKHGVKILILSGLNCGQVTDNGLKLLDSCKAIETFRLLSLPLVTSVGLNYFRKTHAALCVLEINDCPNIQDDDMKVIVTSFKRLHTLILRNLPQLSDFGVKAIGKRSKQFDEIKHLVIDRCKKVGDSGILAMLGGQLRGLTVLELLGLPKLTDLWFMSLQTAVGTPQLRNLTTLSIPGMSVTTSGCAYISMNLQSVEILNLRGCLEIDDTCMLQIGETCLQLKRIDIRQCQNITDIGIKNLLKNGQPNIEHFDLGELPLVTQRCVRIVAKKCPNIKWISMMGIVKLDDEAVCRLAQSCPHLEYINICGGQGAGGVALRGVPRLNPFSLQKLFRCCTKLEHIDLSGLKRVNCAVLSSLAKSCSFLKVFLAPDCNLIRDAGLIALAKNCHYLERVNVARCKYVTNNALCAFGDNSTPLTHLNLACCENINDEGIRGLIMGCSPTLRYLVVRYCEKLTDQSLKFIGSSCFELRRLDITACDEMTPDGLRAMTRNCKKITSLFFNNIIEMVARKTDVKSIAEDFHSCKIGDDGNYTRFVRDASVACREKHEAYTRLVQLELDSAKAIIKRYKMYRQQKATFAYLEQLNKRNRRAAAREVKRKNRERRRVAKACKTIQRVYRGHVGRLLTHERRALIWRTVPNIQRICRGWFGRRLAQEQRWVVMEFKRKKWEMKNLQQIPLQKRWRGYSARINVLTLKQKAHFENLITDCAAKTIQNKFRCYRARVEFHRRWHAALRLVEEMHEAASMLQRCYRIKLARRRILSMRNTRLILWVNNAIVIQTSTRLYFARKKYLHKLEYWGAAAAFLQRCYRASRARRKFLDTVRTGIARKKAEKQGALTIEKAWINYTTKSIANAVRMAMWDNNRLKYSATIMQRCYRRHFCERKLDAFKLQRWRENRIEERKTPSGRRKVFIMENGSAFRIQKWLHNMLARKVTLRYIVLRRLEACTIIQRQIRASLQRIHYKSYKTTRISAIRLIQGFRRTRVARRNFRYLVRDIRAAKRREAIREKVRLKEAKEAKLTEVERLGKINISALIIQDAARHWLEYVCFHH